MHCNRTAVENQKTALMQKHAQSIAEKIEPHSTLIE
jgi:hypothetical protein